MEEARSIVACESLHFDLNLPNCPFNVLPQPEAEIVRAHSDYLQHLI